MARAQTDERNELELSVDVLERVGGQKCQGEKRREGEEEREKDSSVLTWRRREF